MWKKAYEKIQYTLMILEKQQIAIEIKFLNLIKNIYERPTADTMLNGKWWITFLLRQNKVKLLTLIILIQNSTRNCRQASRQVKEIKGT